MKRLNEERQETSKERLITSRLKLNGQINKILIETVQRSVITNKESLIGNLPSVTRPIESLTFRHQILNLPLLEKESNINNTQISIKRQITLYNVHSKLS